MTELDHLLNFFGNPDLDRHRLLQGKWPTYRYECDDPEGWSDDPLELLLLMLVEALPRESSKATPALQALGALLSTALSCLPHAEFSGLKQDFWRGFQYVAQQAAQERGVVLQKMTRDDVRHLIEGKYEPTAT